MLKTNAICVILVVVILALFTTGANATIYQTKVIDTDARANGINNLNQITGLYGANPAVWNLSTGSRVVVSDEYGYGTGINASGQMSVSDNSSMKGYYWNGIGQLQTLPTLGGSCCQAQAINNSGQIVGGASDGNANRAFIWDSTRGTVALSGVPANSWAYGINNSGKVVGTYTLPNASDHAFVWDATNGKKDLSMLPGGLAADAWAVNDSGQAAGRADNGYGWCATRWDADGTAHNLGLLDGWQSDALAINKSGVVIGSIEYQGGATTPFVWDQVSGMRKLATPAGYYECWAVGINDAGWIVGGAQAYVNGSYRTDAILWQPVPEPSSILVMLSGLCGAAGLMCKRRSLR